MANNGPASLTSASTLPANFTAGHAVLITNGNGAGQLRLVTNVVGNVLSVDQNWSVLPDGTSTFTLIHGSSGRAEVLFQRHDNNNHGFPGNDYVVTLRGFGINGGGLLGNPCFQWRTLAHELGHTLGLRHGGTDNAEHGWIGNPQQGGMLILTITAL